MFLRKMFCLLVVAAFIFAAATAFATTAGPPGGYFVQIDAAIIAANPVVAESPAVAANWSSLHGDGQLQQPLVGVSASKVTGDTALHDDGSGGKKIFLAASIAVHEGGPATG